MAGGLCWDGGDRVIAMIWSYYDESGEYDNSGRLLNMSIGGCVSSLVSWQAFNGAWNKALGAEGLTHFHMTDFEAWVPPFDFKLANGSRDKERHNRLLNVLLGLMLDHVEGFYAFTAGT